MTIITAFTFSVGVGMALLALSLATLRWPKLMFWPPPGIGTWQYNTFWWLFRVFVVGVVVVCVLDFGAIGKPESDLCRVHCRHRGLGMLVHSWLAYGLLSLWAAITKT